MVGFFSIGECAKEIGVATHVIRNWCEKFPNLQIQKGSTGRRYFDDKILGELKKIKILIEKYGMSIEGVKKLIKYDKIKPDLLIKDLNYNTQNEQEIEINYQITENIKKEFLKDLEDIKNILN